MGKIICHISMKGCRPSSSTPCRFANVLSKKHRLKKHCHRRTTEHEPNRVANGSSSVDWRAVLPPIIAGVPRRTEVPGTSFSALSSRWRGLSASDVLAPLLTPLTLWRNPPRRTGNRRTGCGITFQSNCHSPCAGLSPAFPI